MCVPSDVWGLWVVLKNRVSVRCGCARHLPRLDRRRRCIGWSTNHRTFTCCRINAISLCQPSLCAICSTSISGFMRLTNGRLLNVSMWKHDRFHLPSSACICEYSVADAEHCSDNESFWALETCGFTHHIACRVFCQIAKCHKQCIGLSTVYKTAAHADRHRRH